MGRPARHIDPLVGSPCRPYRSDELMLAVYAGHPLAGRRSIAFHQTLEHEHVGLGPTTAVHSMLARAAARRGKAVNYRVIVSGFDAAYRVVAARLGIAVIPRQLSGIYASAGKVLLVPLSDRWARRRFAVCFREYASLPPAARRMADYLIGRADT